MSHSFIQNCCRYQNDYILDFIGAKDARGGSDNRSYKTCNLQLNHQYQQTNNHFLQAGCPFCRPTNRVRASKGGYYLCSST